MRRLLFFVSVAVLVGACSFGPDYIRPDMPVAESFSMLREEGDTVAAIAWVDLFRDPRLKDLVTTALERNRELATAAARVEESRALLGFVRADQFPRLDLSGTAVRLDGSEEAATGLRSPFNNFGVFGDLSWELDIWGRLHRASEAQRAELLASQHTYQAISISLISQVAISYFLLIDLTNQVAIAERTRKNRQASTAIIKTRFEGGVVSQLDVNQAEIEEADAAVSLSQLRRNRRQAENALNVLLGRMPSYIESDGVMEDKLTIDAVPVGFPAELLERRPDLRAAEERLRSQTAQIGVAQADRLPRVNLLGFIGMQSSNSSDLFNSSARTWSIGGSLLGPIIDFGKSRSNSEAAKARAEQALYQYEQSVLTAVQEVEDALIAYETFQDEYAARQSQVEAARNAARLSKARYDDGIAPYLEVLDVDRSLFNAELGASTAQRSRLAAVIQLYRALGGGWLQASVPE